jgi:hypothetical protein
MQRGEGRLVVMWGHLALLALIGGVVIAYLLDARATSLRANNLLLVQPASILALILIALVVPQCFRRVAPDPPDAPDAPTETLGDLGKVAALAAAFGAFAVSLEIVGFDVATFAFMVIGLYICGERRWWLNLAFSGVFTVLLIYGYGAIIPFPFMLTVL